MAYGFRRYRFSVWADSRKGSSKARLHATKRVVKAGETTKGGKLKKKPTAKMGGKNKKLIAMARKAAKTRR